MEFDEPTGVFSPPLDDVVPPEERANTIAGRYRIEERIGEGGMGQVLRVSHRRLGKPFALKLMRSELSLDPESRATFNREARLASSLSHPSIVSIVDFGEDPDWGLFLVMEFLEGEALSQRIDRFGPLPVLVVCNVAQQLAEALCHSHDHGVVHADLTAENILCVRDPNYERRQWTIKLLDFGMAHMATVAGGLDERIAGTPEYLAPERIVGEKPRPSVDIYALGIILYEMLAGSVPFSGGAPQDILKRHLEEQPEPIANRRGEPLDPHLDAIVTKCLAKAPAERYGDLRAVLEDVRAYMQQLGLHHRSTSSRAASASDASRLESCAAAFDALLFPVAGVRASGTIVVANQTFARLLKQSLTELEGIEVYETRLASIHPGLREDLRLVAMDGKVLHRRLTLTRPDGSRRHLRLTMTPAKGLAGDCLISLHPASGDQ